MKHSKRYLRGLKYKSFEDLLKATLEYLTKTNKSLKTDPYGELCPRCGLITEVQSHLKITQKHLNQPYYYSQWFRCVNPNCNTTLIMPDRFKVFKDKPVTNTVKEEPRVELTSSDITSNESNCIKPPWEE